MPAVLELLRALEVRHRVGALPELDERVAEVVVGVRLGEIALAVQLLLSILELTGADESLVRHVADRPGHDRRYSVDSSKVRALGWAPETTFDAGMRATVEWYRDNRAWWEPIKSGDFREYYERQYGARLARSAGV